MSAHAGRASALNERAGELAARLFEVRAFTQRLCAPLAIEDYGLQSMADTSPAKWHLAHTSWFFETLVLGPHAPGHRPYHEGWQVLFNSYYESLGPRQPRPQRGLLSRPRVAEVYAYRAAVDEQLRALLADEGAHSDALLDLVELGLNHEQQHQELLLTDLQHGFSCNPLLPAYHEGSAPAQAEGACGGRLIEHEGGLCTIGHDGTDFAFDNEVPAHRVYLEPFALDASLITCGQYQEFIADGGYRRAELWLSDGWDALRAQGWEAPLYWRLRDGEWRRFSLYGEIAVDPQTPVCHVSFYEADAFARWAGRRLPSEQEWEMVAGAHGAGGQFVEDGLLLPVARGGERSLLGGAWVWTRSAYEPYPGFRACEGALGEYNAKFMLNQMVLRGGSCFSPRGHVRATYRNFFPPHARWQVTGIRLAS